MNPQPLKDLNDFYQFVGEKVTNGGASLSPEDVLAEWRTLYPDPDMEQDELAAIQEAIDDLENGDRGMLFEEFDREFRARHNLPPNS